MGGGDAKDMTLAITGTLAPPDAAVLPGLVDVRVLAGVKESHEIND